MTDIVEIIFKTYKTGTHPHDGKIIWSKIFLREEYDRKSKAIKRLISYIENRDKDKHEYILGNTVTINREYKNAPLNADRELVYNKDIDSDKEFHKKAAQRLARYLTKTSDDYNYYGGVVLEEHGENCYILGSRYTKILDTGDKQRLINKKISARKAALTRSINKAKKVRTNYSQTLFPDDYTRDIKYIKLLTNMKFQRSRLSQAKNMKIQDVEDSVGEMQISSVSSFNKLLKSLVSEKIAC